MFGTFWGATIFGHFAMKLGKGNFIKNVGSRPVQRQVARTRIANFHRTPEIAAISGTLLHKETLRFKGVNFLLLAILRFDSANSEQNLEEDKRATTNEPNGLVFFFLFSKKSLNFKRSSGGKILKNCEKSMEKCE